MSKIIKIGRFLTEIFKSNVVDVYLRLSVLFYSNTRCIVMASSQRRHGQDKTLLSRFVCVGGVNKIVDKPILSATENFEIVLSSFEMR